MSKTESKTKKTTKKAAVKPSAKAEVKAKAKAEETKTQPESKIAELQQDRERKTVIMQGNEAVSYGALDAGVDFFAGYPILHRDCRNPRRRAPKRGGYIQMEDEIASICAITGASLTGAKALTATSGTAFADAEELALPRSPNALRCGERPAPRSLHGHAHQPCPRRYHAIQMGLSWRFSRHRALSR